eukprot:jgi/Mesvir1/4598/Mv15825-RA.1
MNDPPKEFLCPLSLDIMSDPVVTETGEIFERSAIQSWFDNGHRTCPWTCQKLKSCKLIPVRLIREMVNNWKRQQEQLERLGATDDAVKVIEGDRLLLGRVIGSGGLSSVRAATLLPSGEQVAVKMLPLQALSDDDSARFRKEVRILQRASLYCRNICRLLGVAEKDNQLCIVMALYEESLEQLINRTSAKWAESHSLTGTPPPPEGADNRLPGLPLSQLVPIAMDVCVAMAELHGMNILVKDLKPANVLLDKYGRAVVADFGISTVLESTMHHASSAEGSYHYMAPEQWAPVDLGGVTTKADVWGFACMVIEMATGAPVWGSQPMMQIMTDVVQKRRAPSVPHALPQELREVLARCFSFAPADRPSFNAILEVLRRTWAGMQPRSLDTAAPATPREGGEGGVTGGSLLSLVVAGEEADRKTSGLLQERVKELLDLQKRVSELTAALEARNTLLGARDAELQQLRFQLAASQQTGVQAGNAPGPWGTPHPGRGSLGQAQNGLAANPSCDGAMPARAAEDVEWPPKAATVVESRTGVNCTAGVRDGGSITSSTPHHGSNGAGGGNILIEDAGDTRPDGEGSSPVFRHMNVAGVAQVPQGVRIFGLAGYDVTDASLGGRERTRDTAAVSEAAAPSLGLGGVGTREGVSGQGAANAVPAHRHTVAAAGVGAGSSQRHLVTVTAGSSTVRGGNSTSAGAALAAALAADPLGNGGATNAQNSRGGGVSMQAMADARARTSTSSGASQDVPTPAAVLPLQPPSSLSAEPRSASLSSTHRTGPPAEPAWPFWDPQPQPGSVAAPPPNNPTQASPAPQSHGPPLLSSRTLPAMGPQAGPPAATQTPPSQLAPQAPATRPERGAAATRQPSATVAVPAPTLAVASAAMPPVAQRASVPPARSSIDVGSSAHVEGVGGSSSCEPANRSHLQSAPSLVQGAATSSSTTPNRSSSGGKGGMLQRLGLGASRSTSGDSQRAPGGILDASTLRGHAAAVTSLVVGHGKVIYSGSADGSLRVWALSSDAVPSYACTGVLDTGTAISALGVDDFFLYTACNTSVGTVKVWGAGLSGVHSFGAISSLEGHAGPILCMALSMDAVYTGSADKMVKIWSKATFGCLTTLVGHTAAVTSLHVPLEADGRNHARLIFSGSEDCRIRVWSASNYTCLAMLSGHESSITSLVMAGEGWLYSGSLDKTIKVGYNDHSGGV